jgi:transcriptional regulator with XRE-family HTH domain
MCLANADDLPGSASSHCENLDIAALSQKVKLHAIEKETNIWDDSSMENKTFEMRRTRLSEWMSTRHLSQVDVATRTGKTRSYVSLVLSAGKSFGEKTARHFETCLHMPKKWLDGEQEMPKASQDFSELANLLAATFDSMDMDDATKQSAFVAASQTLISFAAKRRLLASSVPAPAESQAKQSNEVPLLPLPDSSRQPSRKTRQGQ